MYVLAIDTSTDAVVAGTVISDGVVSGMVTATSDPPSQAASRSNDEARTTRPAPGDERIGSV